MSRLVSVPSFEPPIRPHTPRACSIPKADFSTSGLPVVSMAYRTPSGQMRLTAATGSSADASITCVAPRDLASSRRSETMSTTMIGSHLATVAAITAASPTLPPPVMTSDDPSSGRSVLNIAPAPV
ncbi:hypothetical protein D3C78_1470850 [compost metagenome]